MTDPFAETISKIAHELRSPLTSIKGFSSTLASKWERFNDDQKKQFVETISTDADRMGRIIGEVLDLARLQAGRMELNVHEHSVADVIKRAMHKQQTRPGSERVRIELDPAVTLVGDLDHLETVLGHLIENAIKYSEDGEVMVTAHQDPSGTFISVSDNGQGISSDRFEDLFDGPSSIGTHTPYGSGLGLYLSRSIVERHGGTIAVTSEQGSGSVFEVTLPAGPR
jgi:signal transduction histidine kinase